MDKRLNDQDELFPNLKYCEWTEFHLYFIRNENGGKHLTYD
jgi:hypothetical protein